MRFFENENTTGLVPGSLLLADPAMRDPNFRRSVILLCAHAEEAGALGVILNRPTGKTLGELYQPFEKNPLAKVPVYDGGPVDPNQLLLAAWRWDESAGTVFKLHFGITAGKMLGLMEGSEPYVCRGFLGYAGWEGGQVEGEMEEGAWLKAAISRAIEAEDGSQLWRSLVGSFGVKYRLLSNEPDNPSLN